MQGLIYNLLAELAERAGCQDEAWDVALRSALAPVDGEDEFHDVDDGEELPDLPPLGAATGTTFRCLLRSAAPFRDEDWDDLGAPEPSRDPAPSVPPRAEAALDGDDAPPPSVSQASGNTSARPRRR